MTTTKEATMTTTGKRWTLAAPRPGEFLRLVRGSTASLSASATKPVPGYCQQCAVVHTGRMPTTTFEKRTR